MNLEEEFQKVLENTTIEINKELEIAKKALHKAMELAEEKGVPFTSIISFEMGGIYYPTSFNSKWENLKIYELDGLKLFDDWALVGGTGWNKWNSSSWCQEDICPECGNEI